MGVFIGNDLFVDSIWMDLHILLCSFNDKLKLLLVKEPYISMTASQLFKKMVDYLFLVWQAGTVAYIGTWL